MFARLAFSSLRRPALLLAPCVAATTGVSARPRHQASNCMEPEAEPDAEPASASLPNAASASTALHQRGANSQPPLNPEMISQTVRSFLQRSDGRSFLDSAIRRSAGDETRKLKELFVHEIQASRNALRINREEEQTTFLRYAQKTADEAAQAAAHSEVARIHTLLESAAAAVVRKELNRQVAIVIREDPQIRRMLSSHLQDVRAEVRKAAEKELAEICNEDRHHRVNHAFLTALENRCQESIAKTQKHAYISIAKATAGIPMAKAMGGSALILAIFSILRPVSRL